MGAMFVCMSVCLSGELLLQFLTDRARSGTDRLRISQGVSRMKKI